MFRDDNRDWQKYAKLAEHYQAIDETRIHLYGEGEKPWQYVTNVEPGSTHRLDIATDVRFTALTDGLEFSWSFDIEPRSANGKSGYCIDIEGIQKVIAKLPRAAANQFVIYLNSCAAAVEKKADEYQEEAKRQYGTAQALRVASVSPALIL